MPNWTNEPLFLPKHSLRFFIVLALIFLEWRVLGMEARFLELGTPPELMASFQSKAQIIHGLFLAGIGYYVVVRSRAGEPKS